MSAINFLANPWVSFSLNRRSGSMRMLAPGENFSQVGDMGGRGLYAGTIGTKSMGSTVVQ